jgi:nucleotide-binding universal stress UspA family protein
MALNDVLLHIDSYPDATPVVAIEQAVGFVSAVGGSLSALAVQVNIPLASNRVTDHLIHLSDLVREEEAKSLAACEARLAHFKAAAQAAGVLGQALLTETDLYLLPEFVARRARTRDLCIVPLAGPTDGQREIVEAILFTSGRPALVFQPGEADLAAPANVVVAWDGSQFAARAMAEALPILKAAGQVRILTVLHEKPSSVAGLGMEASRHLEAHGVTAAVDEVEAAGRSIGDVLDAYLGEHRPKLLVMGGYGHTRLREFVLGGATAHMLHRPKTPVFLSH